MKTHYVGHDEAYKKRRARGQAGWDTAEGYEESLAILERSLQAKYVPKSGKLLELGCGAGNIALWPAKKGYAMYGVDIAPTAIEWAREKAKKHHLQMDFRVGSVLDLKEYPDDFFDFVLNGHCFHCIIGEDRKLFLTSAFRVLKPKGFFHIRTMCGDVTNEDMQKAFDPKSRCLIHKGIAMRYIGLPEDILDEIREAGFHILHWEWEKEPPIGENDQLTLLVDALKP
jgi:ubiquinone/menaquinone biosynthesis C-methylase UbiE